MRLPGSTGQSGLEHIFDASGTITSGSAAQLVLPWAHRRSLLIFQNTSSASMYLEMGGPRATATLTSGNVSSISVTNAGFGYTIAPTVEFCGGGFDANNNGMTLGSSVSLPDFEPPRAPIGRPAKAHCVMTGAAGSMTIASIAIDDPGAGYAYPPYIFIKNNLNDPFGCAVPSATSGILLATGSQPLIFNGTITPTDGLAVFCATSTSTFVCKYTL